MQKPVAMVRETGSIIVSERSVTSKKVKEAYEKAELAQWNTKEERVSGTCSWTGMEMDTAPQDEGKEKENNVSWDEYRRDKTSKWSRGSEKIVPTRPPHPIGVKSEQGRKRLIDQWVKDVLREDNMRRRGA